MQHTQNRFRLRTPRFEPCFAQKRAPGDHQSPPTRLRPLAIFRFGEVNRPLHRLIASHAPEPAPERRSGADMAQARSSFADILRGIEQSIHESLDDAFESNSSTRREDASDLLRKSEAVLRKMLDRTVPEEDRRSIIDTLSHVQDLQDQLTISRSAGQAGIASPIARLIHARRKTGGNSGGDAPVARLFQSSAAGDAKFGASSRSSATARSSARSA